MNFYCGIEKEPRELCENDIRHGIKVCNGRDDFSSKSVGELISSAKELPWFGKLSYMQDKYKAVAIRWMYRGLSFEQAEYKAQYQFKMSIKFACRINIPDKHIKHEMKLKKEKEDKFNEKYS